MFKPSKIKLILISFFLLFFLSLPALAQAQSIKGTLDVAAGSKGAGYDTSINAKTGLATIVGLIVRAVLSLLGVIFICYIIYAGFLWLTAAGNDEKVTKAKNILRDGIIGLIIILAAASIYIVVSRALIGLRPEVEMAQYTN